MPCVPHSPSHDFITIQVASNLMNIIFLLLRPPLTMFFYFCYLTFSSGEKPQISTSSRFSRTYQAVQKSHSMSGSEITRTPIQFIRFNLVPLMWCGVVWYCTVLCCTVCCAMSWCGVILCDVMCFLSSWTC